MTESSFEPFVLGPGAPCVFPDPIGADAAGLVAIGGDLSPERLVFAYRHGIFPFYDARDPILWWSPNPRAGLDAESLHVPRRLERTLRRRDITTTWNRAFGDVMRACNERRADGVWILPEMIRAYEELHRLGHAHSLEVWCDGELVGGVYGVQCGAVFAAESKFHRVTDMSKVALVALVRALAARGVAWIDVQFQTDHLARFGVREIDRRDYLERIAGLVDRDVDLSALEPDRERARC